MIAAPFEMLVGASDVMVLDKMCKHVAAAAAGKSPLLGQTLHTAQPIEELEGWNWGRGGRWI